MAAEIAAMTVAETAANLTGAAEDAGVDGHKAARVGATCPHRNTLRHIHHKVETADQIHAAMSRAGRKIRARQ